MPKPPRKRLYVYLLALDVTFVVFALLAGNTVMAAIWAGLLVAPHLFRRLAH